jgi:hypothetical protein
MIHVVRARARALVVVFAFIQTLEVIGSVRADDPALYAVRRVVVTRARPRYVQNASATLGTFQPTPYVIIGGNYPTGSVGYSPGEMYGDTALSLYGPLSAFRVSTAPVLAYSRGYDGQTRLVEANSFSYPNFPGMSPVVYPTEANYYWGPRVPRTPRWGSSAINWIDQN